jgi:hypothetical protein
MNLIPMTDFILQRSEKSISEFTITEVFKDGAKVMNEIFSYARFLKKPVTLKMFEEGDIFFNEKTEFLKETETEFIFMKLGWEQKIHKYFKVEDLPTRGYDLSFDENKILNIKL